MTTKTYTIKKAAPKSDAAYDQKQNKYLKFSILLYLLSLI